MQPFSTVLFDLDGTLTDSQEGIIRCFMYALERMNYPVPPRHEIMDFIGPPLHATFSQRFQMDEAMTEQAVTIYRERFGTVGLFENVVYPGIPELLASLKNAGITLAVATSKAEVYARRILAHFDLAQYFSVIVGSELDGRRTEKSDVIAAVLEALPATSFSHCVMIGDRKLDIFGARKNGIPTIAVAYGYGSPEELSDAHPLHVATSVTELASLLGVSLLSATT